MLSSRHHIHEWTMSSTRRLRTQVQSITRLRNHSWLGFCPSPKCGSHSLSCPSPYPYINLFQSLQVLKVETKFQFFETAFVSSNKSSTEDLDEVTCLEGKSNNRATLRMLRTLMMMDDDDTHDDDGDNDNLPAKNAPVRRI